MTTSKDKQKETSSGMALHNEEIMAEDQNTCPSSSKRPSFNTHGSTASGKRLAHEAKLEPVKAGPSKRAKRVSLDHTGKTLSNDSHEEFKKSLEQQELSGLPDLSNSNENEDSLGEEGNENS